MTRKWLLALLALIIVTPAVAQLTVQPIQRPIAIQPIPAPDSVAQQEADLSINTMTVEQARQKIFELYRERRELNAKLTEALGTIEQMTQKGGSLVRAYCETKTVSRNTAGATEDCAATGYVCGDVSGLCKTSCTTGPDCAASHACDVDLGKCVPKPTA